MVLERYPQRLALLLAELEAVRDPAGRHKILLDLGEALLVHLTAVMFGEYRGAWDIDEPLEAELYRRAKSKPSFGVYLNFLRQLVKANGASVFDEYVVGKGDYPAVSTFVFEYELLKNEVVNRGYDGGFTERLETVRKGRTVAGKSLLQFFETFVAVRNTYAHPEGKAKNPERSWPLGDEYYDLLNPLMEAALRELVSGIDVLDSLRPVLVEKLDEEAGRVDVQVEVGKQPENLALDLEPGQATQLKVGLRYAMDENHRFRSRYYGSGLPGVNPAVAPRIIRREKARMMEPVLKGMIEQKLADGVIDDLEYLVLKETAFSSHIEEARLRALVDSIKASKGIEGDVYVESKSGDVRPMLDPYWLAHFGGLNDATVEQSDDCLNPTNLHRNLWNEITAYLCYLVETNLDNQNVSWKVQPNRYQQGRLSFQYWGQVYPEFSPFQNGFSVGFIVAKNFKWVKARKSNPLREKLDQPCMLLYSTMHNTRMERMDPSGALEREYGRLNYQLLLRECERLEKMGGFTSALSYRTRDIHDFPGYFREKTDDEEDERLWIYSKIWNCADFVEDGRFHPGRVYRVEKELVAYLTLLSNVVLDINDYAVAHGFGTD